MSFRFAFQLTVALAASAGAAWYLKPDALSAAASDIVSTLSIVNAAIFPTVVLSATVLKAGGLSLDLVERYRTALRTQISFFFGILFFSLMSISAVIVAQVMKWQFRIDIAALDWHFAFDGIFNAVIIFLSSFVLLRLPAFLRALMSLINVHIDSVAHEVSQRDAKQREDRREELEALPNISGHQHAPQPFAMM